MDYLFSQFKKGFRTTEFWLTAATFVVLLVEGLTGLDLDNESILALVGANASYVLGRSWLKGKRVVSVSNAVHSVAAYGDPGDHTKSAPSVMP